MIGFIQRADSIRSVAAMSSVGIYNDRYACHILHPLRPCNNDQSGRQTVYRAICISIFFYGRESWTPYSSGGSKGWPGGGTAHHRRRKELKSVQDKIDTSAAGARCLGRGQASAPPRIFFGKLVSHWCIFVHSDSFLARDSIICLAHHMLSPARPSVTRQDHSKTVQVRIMQFSPQGSPIPLVFEG